MHGIVYGCALEYIIDMVVLVADLVKDVICIQHKMAFSTYHNR